MATKMLFTTNMSLSKWLEQIAIHQHQNNTSKEHQTNIDCNPSKCYQLQQH